MSLEARVNQVRTCDFAGEIALTEAELRDLAELVKQDLQHTKVPRRHAPERLIVAAVNCAFYSMDGGGFWEPFCRLLGVEHSPGNTQAVGCLIGDALLHLDFVSEEGFGPNRYVTPIRRHAGITKRDFPSFAELLQRGHATVGLRSLKDMPQNELATFVDRILARTVFTDFLKTDLYGARLLQDVARDLLLRHCNLISEDDLCHLPGYRPGFWAELLLHLGTMTSSGPGAASLTGHRVDFVFDEPSKCCGLRFDREEVNRGVFRFDGQTVRQSFVRFENVDQFRAEFCVTAEGSAMLPVPGWEPSSQRPFALFRSTGEFVPHGSPVPPGECWLLALIDFEPPQDVQRLSDFEWCGDIVELHYWQIRVEGTTDMVALGYTNGDARSDVALRWEKHQSICFLGDADGRDVFASTLPKLRVTGLQIIREKRATVCWSDGARVQPLPLLDQAGDEVVVSLPAHAPCMGEVWVEPLGRQRLKAEQSLGGRLRFCLLPSCTFEWPSTLCAEDDEPLVVFRCETSKVQCDFPECSLMGHDESFAVWKVPTNVLWLHAELSAGEDVTVRLSHRIHRARLEPETGEAFWVDRSALAADNMVRIHGEPGTPVRLRFEAPDGEEAGEIHLLQSFDQHGLQRVAYRALGDGIRDGAHAVISVSVLGTAGWARTQARIVDLGVLERWLADSTRPPHPPWLAVFGEAAAAILESLARVSDEPKRGSPEAWSNDALAKLPSFLSEWARGLFACACVLTPYQPAGEPWSIALGFLPESNQCRRAVEWALRARDAIRNWDDDRIAASGLASEYHLLNWQSLFTAWDDYLLDLHKQLTGRQHLVPMLEEWKAEITAGVQDGRPLEWQSQLSRMTGGEALSDAYFHNLHSERQQGEARSASWSNAYQHASRVNAMAEEPSGIVSSLAWMVKRLALSKYDSKVPPDEMLPERCPKNLVPLPAALQSHAIDSLKSEDIDAALVLLDHLPIPAEDWERIRAGLAKRFSDSTRTNS